ncbi:MAG: putative E3 ubiquitin-protein ligase RGLG4 [Streblomastix strix]|uniref:Putative E3 ubiquitin-protein ligase RGLG4 n=1 Tax=Streblomastix strix TaxID=222440 RepID=A0A5J4WRY8_9EUKA|nr:MAG: putative E3 ubiquitin-protein ligase RGLG4 [Streblomastix strix]
MGSSSSKSSPARFKTIQEVQKAIRSAGLESSNLIFGIDYTCSNEDNGKISFHGKSLHNCTVINPYMEVIQILGETLEPFDDDHIIPTFGFGDMQTSDKKVFPFFPDRQPLGFKEVLERYKEITPKVRLHGPTSFRPLINEAIRITKDRRAYHILVIVTDGKVTNEQENIQAIVDASNYPISIICIGVGLHLLKYSSQCFVLEKNGTQQSADYDDSESQNSQMKESDQRKKNQEKKK